MLKRIASGLRRSADAIENVKLPRIRIERHSAEDSAVEELLAQLPPELRSRIDTQSKRMVRKLRAVAAAVRED